MSFQNDLEACRDRNQIDLDTIILEVGQFGKYQVRTIALCSILVIFVSWANSEYVFTTSRINTRCYIEECESDWWTADYAPHWILNAVPGENVQSIDNCHRFGNVSTISSANNDTCPAELFDRSVLKNCEEYVFENNYSIVYDFNLACDEWRRSFIGSMRTVGNMIALPLTGFISDRWGRKTALIINAFNTMWLGIVRYWTKSYIGFITSEFIEAVFGAGVYSCTYILLTELVGPKHRVLVGAIMSTSFSIGLMFLGLISWAIPNWRSLTISLYIPQVVVILYYWLISESVRWYMSKGWYEKSEKVLKKLAKTNGVELSQKSLAALRFNAEEEKKQRELNTEKNKETWLVIEVFSHKQILIRCMITPIWWITCILTYYGLSINAVNMSGNKYLNYIAVASAEIPGHWLSMFLMRKVGRKHILISSFWFCAACLLTFVFIPQSLPGLSLAVYLVGVCCNAMVVIAVYVYTAELYPTKYRHSLFAISSMLGRTGNIIAPLTPAIGAATFYELPFLIFAVMALLSGALVFLTPETYGTKLPDTMEEACNIDKNKIIVE